MGNRKGLMGVLPFLLGALSGCTYRKSKRGVRIVNALYEWVQESWSKFVHCTARINGSLGEPEQCKGETIVCIP